MKARSFRILFRALSNRVLVLRFLPHYLGYPFRKKRAVSTLVLRKATTLAILPVDFDWKRFPSLVRSLKDDNPDAELISFDFRSREACPEVRYWRQVLSTGKELELNEAGRVFVEKWLASLSPDLRRVFLPFHSSLVEIAFRLHTLNYFATQAQKVLVITAPANAAKALRRLQLSDRSLIDAKWVRFPRFSSWLERRLKSLVERLGEAHQAEYAAGSRELIWSPGTILSGSGPVCIGILEDSGTNLNMIPGRLVFSRLAESGGVRLVVLTSSFAVVRSLRDVGVEAYRFPHVPWPSRALQFAEQYSAIVTMLADAAESSGEPLDQIFYEYVSTYLYSWMLLADGAAAVGTDIASRYYVPIVVSINEQISSAIALASALDEIRWIAYSPILLFDHPESKFFPADIHLVYGTQLMELMRRAGVNESSIEIVGSCSFESAHARLVPYNDASRDFRKEHLPGWSGERVIVVGTENRAGQMEDIATVIQYLAPMNNLYVVIKLHPEDTPAPFEALVEKFGGAAMMLVRKEMPLEPLLASCEFLICMRSNIIITAALLGTPTLICDFSDGSTVIDFEKEGIARKCTSSTDFPAAVREMLDPGERSKIREKVAANIHRFNGLNDGLSAERVVSAILEKCGVELCGLTR